MTSTFLVPFDWGMGLTPSVLTAAAQQMTIPASATQQNGFSRLQFSFPVEVPFRVNTSGTQLQIIFDASFTPAFTPAFTAGLNEFSGASYTNADGTTTVTMTVNARAYAREYRRQTTVIIDLYPQTPQFILDRQQRMRQMQQGNRSQSDRQQNTQQNTNQPNTNQPNTNQSAESQSSAGPTRPGGTATTNTGNTGPTRPGGGSAATEKPANSITPPGGNSQTAQSNTAEGKSDEAADSGTADSGKAGATSDTEKSTATEKSESIDIPPDGSSADRQKNRDTSDVVDLQEVKASARDTTDQGAEYSQGQDRSKSSDNLDVELKVLEKSKSVDINATSEQDARAQMLDVKIRTLPDLIGVSFEFDMPELVPSAVFERYGNLWVIFDRKMNVNNQGFVSSRNLLEGRVQTIDFDDHKDATVIRMAIRANQNIIMEIENGKWVLQLKDTPTRPRFPLSPQRRNDSTNGNHIFIEASEIGTRLTIPDPTIEDEIIVLPLLGMGRGLSYARSYTEAVLMQTAQGVVIEPLSDQVIVNRYRNGIAVKTAFINDLQKMGEASTQKLIDFKAWRQGPPEDYKKVRNRLKLLQSLTKDKSAQNNFRWQLARFYLAHKRPGEALAMINLIIENDPRMEQNDQLLAVRGIANFKKGRYLEATNDLFRPTFNGEQDIALWRTMLTERSGRTEDALDHYRRGKDVIGGYAQQDRAAIQLAVVRAAIKEKQFDLAGQELDLFDDLDQDQLKPYQSMEAKYLRGKLAEAEGRQSEALAIYDELTRVRHYRMSAYARLARVKHNIANNDITDDEAIIQLERLRFAWRGPKFESQVVDILSDLYIQKKQYVRAFDLVRNNVPYFQEEANELRLVDKMRRLYRFLFADGESNNIDPVKAVSIFFEYEEYLPKGVEGDRIVLKLANRLVDMDLLDKAAELYLQQVKRQETASARANVAADLARIYIMDRKPKMALDIITASRSPNLPPDVIDKRRWVEAKALIEMGKYEEAEFRLEDDNSDIANELRADLYWGAEDWEKLAISTEAYLGDGWKTNTPLDQKQRLYLIRSCIALTYMQDKSGLQDLRSRYGLQMRVGDLKTAFEILTNSEELSGFEVSSIVDQIANIDSLKTFMQNYRSDFPGSQAAGGGE